MSTERNTITSEASKDLHVTSFSGGERGRCLQLTQAGKIGRQITAHGYVQLDREQALKLAQDILAWDLGQ